MLDAPLPPALASSDVAVRRKIAQAFGSAVLQHLSEASQLAHEAQALAESSQPQLLGNVALVRGNIEDLRGHPDLAERSFREALGLARQQQDRFLEASALGSMGLITIRQARYDEAADWNAQALTLARSVGAEGSVGRILGNLAWSYTELGDFEKALAYHQQAEDVAERSGVVDNRIHWLNGIAVDYLQMHDYALAETTWLRTLALARGIDDKPAITEALNNLCEVTFETNRIDEAEKYNRQAVEIEKQGSDAISAVYSLLASARIEAAKGNFPQSEQLFQKLLQDPAIETSVRWSAESRLAQVYAQDGHAAQSEQLFRKSIATIEAARSSVRREEFRLTFLSDAIKFYDNYVQFLVSRGRPVDALQAAELSRSRTLADGLGISSRELSFPIRGFQPSQTAAKLKSTILYYWLGSPHSYLWVVSPSRVDLLALPPASEIDPLVQSYRQALVGPRDALATNNASGHQLFDILIAPAQKHVPPQSRVTILPDGSLYGLNFETLLVSSPLPHYWIEDADVDYANSLVLLSASARTTSSPSKKLLLIGAPVSPGSDFPDLSQAAAEIHRIENHFPPADRVVIEHDRATPAAYLDSQPAQFSFIHFVAHGVASRTDPLDSAVILTRQGDAYKLYARDIVQHPIHADVVTISACNGAGERTFSGEGLVGLSWAFLRAGARGVISALWEVDDTSTPQLMDHLYGEISKGASPDSALRDAKLALLHSRTIYSKPLYWAPFELYRGI